MLEKISNRSFYAMVFGGFLTIFLLSISNVIAISHDSVFYVLGAKNTFWHFHPHHLLYHILNVLVLSIFQIPKDATSVQFVMSAVNSVFGALTILWIVRIFVEQFGLKKLNALFASGIIAFTYGFWYYSACVEVYIIPLFFVVLTYYYYFKDKNNTIAIGVLTGLATLFHQSYVFLFPIVILLYIFDKITWRRIINYSLVFSIIVGFAYLYVLIFINGARSIDEAIYYLTFYAKTRPEHWASFGPKLLINDIIGFGRSIFSIHFIFGYESLAQAVEKRFPNNSFNEEIYLVRNMAPMLKILLPILLVFLMGFFVRLAYRATRGFLNSSEKSHKRWFFFYMLFFVSFFTVWSANNPEFWISIYTILAITVFKFYKFERRDSIVLGIHLAVLFAFNLLSTFIFVKDIKNDYYLSKIEVVKEFVGSRDFLIVDDNYKVEDYLTLFDIGTNRRISEFNSTSELIQSLVDSTKSQKIDRILFVDEIFSSKDKQTDKYRSAVKHFEEQNLLNKQRYKSMTYYELNKSININR